MNSSALLLLVSAFLHATWNAIAKSSKDKETFLFLAMTVGNIVAGITVWNSGVFQPGSPLIFAIFAGLFEGAYFVTLTKALKQSELGRAYTIMRGGAMLVVWIVSCLFFQETASLLQIFGAVLIFTGIILLSAFASASQKAKVQTQAVSKVPWAWICAVCIAGYHLSYHKALHHGGEPKSLFALSMFISWPFLIIAMGGNYRPRIKAVLKDQWGRVFITGAASFLSFVIFLYGLQVSAPGFAISLRNSSIFFAILFSFFLRESLTRVQILGASIVGVGALLLSWN